MSGALRANSSSVPAARRARRERVRDRVIARGEVRIDELVEEFGVSTMTIHRDLDELARQGWLRKVRGGASAEPSVYFHGNVRQRMQAMVAEKQSLARAAAEMIGPGDAIVLDDSTTALGLTDLLADKTPLTVVTNFLPAVNALAGHQEIDLISLGGAYFPAYEAFLGMRTVESIRSLHADTLFMSTTAIVNGHCFHLSTETIQVKRALMQAVATKVLLVDHSKFSKRALHELGPLTDFDVVLVDDGIDRRILESVTADGVAVRVVPTTSASTA